MTDILNQAEPSRKHSFSSVMALIFMAAGCAVCMFFLNLDLDGPSELYVVVTGVSGLALTFALLIQIGCIFFLSYLGLLMLASMVEIWKAGYFIQRNNSSD